MSDREITPGDIYWLALPGPDGSEPGIAHPHAVIDALNCADTVMVCALSIYQSSGASRITSFMSDEVNGMDRKVACFECVTQTEFETDYLFDWLIDEPEIRRHLEFLADHTLKLACET